MFGVYFIVSFKKILMYKIQILLADLSQNLHIYKAYTVEI